MAPEYALRGHLTEKADVFGFGIVVLEVVSGRPNFYIKDNERIYLLERVRKIGHNTEFSFSLYLTSMTTISQFTCTTI